VLSRSPYVPRTTDDPTALAEVYHLCRDGRLYDVERWIQSGRPLQLDRATAMRQRLRTSVLAVALDTRNHGLVLLLLMNGHDTSLELHCPLNLALRTRQWDLLDMLRLPGETQTRSANTPAVSS
jgi:hypothetical protein